MPHFQQKIAFGVTRVPQEQVGAGWGTVPPFFAVECGGGANAEACAFLGVIILIMARLVVGAAGAAAAGAIASTISCIWDAMAAIVASREAMRSLATLRSTGSGGVSLAARSK